MKKKVNLKKSKKLKSFHPKKISEAQQSKLKGGNEQNDQDQDDDIIISDDISDG